MNQALEPLSSVSPDGRRLFRGARPPTEGRAAAQAASARMMMDKLMLERIIVTVTVSLVVLVIVARLTACW